jgi:hypothetical protein
MSSWKHPKTVVQNLIANPEGFGFDGYPKAVLPP